MQSFPILKLPLLAQFNVIDNMDTNDLFVFSLISIQAKHLVITTRRRSIKELSWEFELSESERHLIHLSETHRFAVPMRKTLEEAVQTEKLEEWKLNGQLIPMYRSRGTWYIGDQSQGNDHHYQLLEVLSAHILKVFRCQEFNFWSASRSVPEHLFVFQHTRRFNSLRYFNSISLPAENLKFALEQLEVRELYVEQEVPDFEWTGPLRMELLHGNEMEWVTFEALMNMECKELALWEHVFTDAELNLFLKKWQAGGFPNLEYCSFHEQESDANRILRDIETFPYNPENRPEAHPINGDFLSQGVDIRRNDGVYSTIDIYGEDVIMAVWNNV